MASPFIELRGISKRFAGVQALSDLSLAIQPGEIHCLAGENGSGKSTVIKIMSGVYQADEGEILINGELVGPLSPRRSTDCGIQVIYQDFSLFGNLTVAENLALNGQLQSNDKLIRWGAARKRAAAAVARLGIDANLDAEVDSLPVAGKQLVAIARALMSDARLIIMDEPTTALTSREVATLFRIVREIQQRGIAVLFVSHKMREMLDISEQLTVIRNGAKVAEGPTANFNETKITEHMTGQRLQRATYAWQPQGNAVPPRLTLRGLTLPGAFDNLDLTLRAGEIVGLAGLLGSGRTALATTLFGMHPQYAGAIQIDGQAVELRNTPQAIAQGVAYVPEDRLSEGLFHGQSINQNLLASALDRVASWSLIRRQQARAMSAEMIRIMQVATPSGEKPVGQLSGGNQQRVMIGRWLLTNARIMVLNGPTVGVDVGSKAEIHRKLQQLAEDNGLAVLMISDDILELIQNCNRIHIMHRGALIDDLEASMVDEDSLNDRLKQLT